MVGEIQYIVVLVEVKIVKIFGQFINLSIFEIKYVLNNHSKKGGIKIKGKNFIKKSYFNQT